MLLSRNAFFLILAFIFIGLPVAKQIIWLSLSARTTGKVWFQGHTLEVQNGISSHPVILFYLGNDSFYFNAPGYLPVKEGDQVPVLYQKNDPPDAIVYNLRTIWFDSMVFSFFPVLVLLVLYITPERMEPLIPRRSRIRIGFKPLIRIIRDK